MVLDSTERLALYENIYPNVGYNVDHQDALNALLCSLHLCDNLDSASLKPILFSFSIDSNLKHEAVA